MNLEKISFLKQIIIYFIIIVGYLLVYYIPLDQLIWADKKVDPTSKINFIYQQF